MRPVNLTSGVTREVGIRGRIAWRSALASRRHSPLFVRWMLRGALTQIGIAIVVGAASTASSAAVARSQRDGVLELRGGIQAQTTINHSQCSAGPGNSIAIALVDVGGWSSLDLSASAPRHDKHGEANVSLQGTGYKTNGAAIAVWSWAKEESAQTSAQVRITGNGTAGVIDVKVPLATVDDSPSVPSVVVALTWSPAAC
jgi:hypothetical protein